MRVFAIVGLLLIATAASAAIREKSVEQIHNESARKMFVLTFYHFAVDRVCDAAKTGEENDNCARAHWALWREIDLVRKGVKLYNGMLYDYCSRLMNSVRDHMLFYQERK
ncbi:MAG: hypothetical protein AAB731_01400 [Patescibacteria group bacterium]